MANDNYIFLLDVKNSRQYYLPVLHGKLTQKLRAFAENPKDAGFDVGEAVFAIDERSKEIVKEGGKTVLKCMAYQFNIKETDGDNTGTIGKGSGCAPVTFEMSTVTDAAGRSCVQFTLTKESEENLRSVDITTFPRSFTHVMTPVEAGMKLERLAPMLPFPPQHADGAYLAHKSLNGDTEIAKPYTPPVEEPTMKEERKRPKQPFNRTTERKNYKVPDAVLDQLFKQYGRNLSEAVANGDMDPVEGRDAEVKNAIKVLRRRKQSSICFTGDAGCGKTTMFAAVAAELGDDATVIQLDLLSMGAGTRYRGDFEAKLQPIIDGITERRGQFKGRKLILAIDEIHAQGTAGKAEGGTDAFNMIKPMMAEKGVSIMGTTTDAEYKKHIEKDAAIVRRFEKAPITAPSYNVTMNILKRLWPETKEHNSLTEDLSDADFHYIVTMTNRYAPQESQPSKAEKAMMMAASSAEVEGRTVITRDDINAAIEQMAKLPANFLSQNDYERFLKLEEKLPQEVLGQPGLARIAAGLIGARAGLADENQPWGCFVLQGPTGTGKTETCKALARYLFDDESALIKLDMSEYSDKHTVSRLIGAPPGFVGFDSAEPALTEKIRNRPYSILLLDEIEKAHPDVFNVLLPLLNDGKMTDNQGKTVLFNNVIVIMTTNAGAKDAMNLIANGRSKSRIGDSFGKNAKEMSPEKMEAELTRVYRTAVTRPQGEGRPALFRPEMINRIEELGGFITYLPLDQKVISNLVLRELSKTEGRLNGKAGANLEGVKLEVSDAVKAQLAKEGYDPAMGARPLRKVVKEKINNPLGRWVMSNRDKIMAFVAQHGAAKVVINSLDNFAPQLVKTDVAVANDNKSAAPRKSAKPKI